jgi:hypothetical protein
MIDINAWPAGGAGLLCATAAAVNLSVLLRTHLRHRALVRLERERSARSIARTAEVVRMLHHPHARVRVVERDSDGERLIEIGGPAGSGEMAA